MLVRETRVLLLLLALACRGGDSQPRARTGDAGRERAPTGARAPAADASPAPSVAASPSGRAVRTFGEVPVEKLVRRNHARMERDRHAPVHVVSETDPVEAGRRICEAVVPRRPPETPVLVQPNLSGFDRMRLAPDDGMQLRVTGTDFLRGVVRCLKSRGHRLVTIADGWTGEERLVGPWLRRTGVERLGLDEGVRVVPLLYAGRQDPLGEPFSARFPGARRLRTNLLVPRVVAEHLESGLVISVPKMKMSRFSVMSLSVENGTGAVMLADGDPPHRQRGRLSAEISDWLRRRRETGAGDREEYVAALELYAERVVDVLEVVLPDAVLVDGVPPVAGDGFDLVEPLPEAVAIGSANPVSADAVALEWMGYSDNADLAREIGHATSPLVEEAARRFYGSTDAIARPRIAGDASFRSSRRVAHYRAFPGFEIGAPPDPMGAIPWVENAVTALRASEDPVLDGRLDDAAWSEARPVPLERDFRGRPAGPETIVRVSWTPEALWFAVDGAFERLVANESAPTDEERPGLWREESFFLLVDPDPATPRTYREIGVGPYGHFADADVDGRRRPREDFGWTSGIRVAATVDDVRRRFSVEARVPATAFGAPRLGVADWKVALDRIPGSSPGTVLARFPTRGSTWDPHVPDSFGWLRLVER